MRLVFGGGEDSVDGNKDKIKGHQSIGELVCPTIYENELALVCLCVKVEFILLRLCSLLGPLLPLSNPILSSLCCSQGKALSQESWICLGV